VIQIAQHHFNSKTVQKKQRTAGRMPHLKPIDLDTTKHSDYFVWKEMSEHVARRCDDTVDKKRVNSCVLKHLFLEGVEQPKISPKNPENALSDALLMWCSQDFAADAALTPPVIQNTKSRLHTCTSNAQHQSSVRPANIAYLQGEENQSHTSRTES